MDFTLTNIKRVYIFEQKEKDIELAATIGKQLLDRNQQLEINQQLMSLSGDFISPDNMSLIKDAFNNPYELNMPLFLQLYHNDKLGESIPNAQAWMNQLFGYLDSFK
jgi:hypothetical protein